MKTTHQLITLLLFSFILFACKEEEHVFNTQENLFDCHQQSTWDSSKIDNALLGDWEWDYIQCNSPGSASSEIYKELSIEFKSDNTLDVKENGQVTQTSSWEVKGVDDLFWIETLPDVPQLAGTVYLCDEKALFHASHIDVCDNFFNRK